MSDESPTSQNTGQSLASWETDDEINRNLAEVLSESEESDFSEVAPVLSTEVDEAATSSSAVDAATSSTPVEATPSSPTVVPPTVVPTVVLAPPATQQPPITMSSSNTPPTGGTY